LEFKQTFSYVVHRVAIPMRGMSCDFVYRHCLSCLSRSFLFVSRPSQINLKHEWNRLNAYYWCILFNHGGHCVCMVHTGDCTDIPRRSPGCRSTTFLPQPRQHIYQTRRSSYPARESLWKTHPPVPGGCTLQSSCIFQPYLTWFLTFLRT
jgi:hypothetical protein